MKRNNALGVALLVALSGSLLVGCSSDNADSVTPPANPLVGTWVAKGFPDNPVVVLEMASDGSWKYLWGPSRDRVVMAGEGSGTYEVNEDTVTWLGGACDEGVKGIYTYTLENGQFTQMVKDDPCPLRKVAYDAVIFTAETASPSPAAS